MYHAAHEWREVASIMFSCFTFSIDSMIRAYHVLKDLCTDPNYDEELECVCNLSNPHVVAVKKEFLEMQSLLDMS